MLRLPRLAIATLPGLDHFVPELAAGLQRSGRTDVRVFAVRGQAEIAAMLAWTDAPDTDAVWFEFCWPPFPALIAATDFGRRRVVVRIHRIEAYGADHVARADWTRVTDVVVVSEHMAERVRSVAPSLLRHARLHVIHNGLDLDRFAAGGQQRDSFRIGWCGWLSLHKNPMLAVDVLYRLRQLDPRYRLHVTSRGGEPVATEAMCHMAARLGLAEAIVFDGAVAAAGMPAWHARNAALLSTSAYESFGYAIAEAAASGCDLAVLDHVGADAAWPDAVRFVLPEQAAQLLHAARPGRWRDWVAERFSLVRQVEATLAMLEAPRSQERFSATYWEQRYRHGGTSGAGSVGQLAAFKADVLNRLVREFDIRSVLELGCGDGQQLALADYPDYVGVDVSAASVALCREQFRQDPAKRFQLLGDMLPSADLALSLDVIFHLVEDDVFHAHMAALFGAAGRVVAIYASDRDEITADRHVRHRDVSAWIARHAPGWERLALIRNPYPFDPDRPHDTSFANFSVYAPRVAGAIGDDHPAPSYDASSAATAEVSSRM